MIVNPHAASVVRLARVTGVDPEGQKLEVIFLDTGDYGRDVQVLSPYAGTDFGFTSGIPVPEEEGHDVNVEDNDPDKRHIIAAVASVQGVHLCLGFVYPQVTQMAFTKKEDKNRLIERHTSDFYRTVSDTGNMDMVHPGGSFFSITENDGPDNLVGRDYDGVWKIKHNVKGANVILNATGPNGLKSTITLEPSGDIGIHAEGDISVFAAKTIGVLAEGTVSIKSSATVNIMSAGSINMTAAADVVITAGGTIRHEAPVVYEVTPTHITTGRHTDMDGKHCPSC